MLLRSRQRGQTVRVLDDRDLPAARAVLAADPVAHCFVASRVEACGLDAWRLGAEMWGIGEGAALSSLCFSGANLLPVAADVGALRAYAERARRQGRRCSSLVGPAEDTLTLWHLLEPHWGSARAVRPDQPLMAIEAPAQVTGDSRVRRVRSDELELLLPACIAMFTEEVGVSPVADGGDLYRSRVAELIRSGRSFARIDGGRVVFKAEIGAVAQGVCQVQGVWVDPELRGTGLGLTGTAAVVDLARRTLAPIVSLYVNGFNAPARRVYDLVGFRQVGTYASILF
jgi:predicted GNAT family acetyltransferase